MREKILELEEASTIMEPTAGERKPLRRAVIHYLEAFLNKIETYPAYVRSPESKINISEIEPGERLLSIEEIVFVLSQTMDVEGINPASGGHLGYIPGGGIYISALADYWAAITNRYAGVFYANPDAVRLENKLIKWLSKVVGYGEHAHGNLTSGGSMANLIGVVTARNARNLKAVEIPESCIYLTRQAHHSIAKAIRVAGLHECHIRYIDMDEQYRMDMAKLENQIAVDKKAGLKPFMLIGSAGTTDVGAIDPLDDMANLAEKYDLWFHVDGAYGGFFILVDEIKEKFKGLERADSLVIDPHKGLFLPYGLGVCLVKEGKKLQEAFTFNANYLQDITAMNDEVNPMDSSPEMTKHFRGLRLWIPVMLYGIEPFKAALQEKLLLARYFYNAINEMPDWETDQFPQLSVITFRYVPETGNANEINKSIIDYVLKDGRIFFSSTTIDGKFTLRLAILSFRSHLRTIDLAIDILKEAALKATAQQ